MATLFAVLFFTSLICLIVGLIAPHSFTSLFRKKPTRKMIGLTYGIAAIAFFILFSFFDPNSNRSGAATVNAPTPTEENIPTPTDTPTPTPEISDLDVKIRDAYSGLEIINNENNDLSDCNININEKLFDLGYQYHDPLIDKQGDVTIPYSWFATSDGKRFNNDELKVHDIYISCLVNGKKQSASFKNNN